MQKNIDFMSLGRYAMVFSGILILISLVSLATRGLNFGIDFTGGTVMEVGYPDAKQPDDVRNLLSSAGYNAVVQHFGSARELMIRLPPLKNAEGNEASAEEKAKLSNTILALLQSETPQVEMRRTEFVGPQIGEELRDQGGLAMLLALAGILVYVTLRFEFRFSLGAIIALIHDVVVVVGFFSITQREFDLTILAAILAVIGYSLNDTIVVYDRQRENFRILRNETAKDVLNISVNQTLSRTIMTSLTTMLVVLALYLLGSSTIAGFAVALLIGIAMGTYSSIYVASILLLAMGVTKETLIPPSKENQDELDSIP